MSHRILASIAALAFAVLGYVAPALLAQQKPPVASASAGTFDAKDLNGIWGRGAATPAPASQVKADARGFLPDGGLMTEWGPSSPLTPKGLAQVNNNKSGKGPRQVPPAFANDLLGDANPPGLLRALVYGRPFQMIVLPDKVVTLFEWTRVWREVWTDGRKPLEDIGAFWYGTSVGRWDGDTFVVETTNLDARAWMDQWGTPFSESIKVTERWRRSSKDNLELTMTIDDPVIFTKPWTTAKRNFRFQTKDMPDGEMLEVIFAPVDEKEFNDRVRDPAANVTR